MPIPQWLAEAMPGLGAIVLGAAAYAYLKTLHDRMMRARAARRQD